MLFAACAVCRAAVLEGIVRGAGGNAIIGAACAVYSLPDSIMVSAATTDTEGRYKVESPRSGDWYLEVSFMGYNRQAFSSGEAVAVPGKPFEITLEPKTEELSEVVVRAHKPQLTLRDGVFSYNVEEIVAQRVVVSAHELLKELPLVTSPDGTSLRLSGSHSGTVVYLNGKKTTMTEDKLLEYLKSVPADMVAGVDLVYEPTPRWKTRSAVINVVLRRHHNHEANGMLQAAATHKWLWSANASGNLFASTPKLDINVMYSPSTSGSKWRSDMASRHTYGGELHIINDTSVSRTVTRSHSVYASADYKINANNSVELSYSGAFSPESDNRYTSANSLLGRSGTRTKSSFNTNALSLVFSGKHVESGIEYTHHETNGDLNMSGLIEEMPVYSSVSHQHSNRVKAYADLSTALPFGLSLSYGASYELTHSRNSQRASSDEASMEASSFRSASDEHIAKGYAGVRGSLLSNRLFFNASVSAESYSMLGRHDFQVFPTFVCSYSPATKHTVQGSYSTYHVFPSYWNREDYRYFKSPYELREGNPGLRPMRYHVARVMYMLDSKYTASASYYRVNNFSLSQPYQSPDRPYLVYRPLNLTFCDTWSVTLTAPFSVGQSFFTTFELQGNRERYRTDDWHGLSFNKSNTNIIARSYNTLVVSRKPKISLSLNGWYRTPSLYGIEERSAMLSINGGVTCTFFDDRLGLYFYANDILGTQTPEEKIRVGAQNMDIYYNYHNRSLSLTVSYRFKGYRNRLSKNPDTSRYGIE